MQVPRIVPIMLLAAAGALCGWAAVWFAINLDIAGVVTIARFIGAAVMTLGALSFALLAFVVASNGIRGG